MSDDKNIDMEKLIEEIRNEVWAEIGKAHAEKIKDSKNWDKKWYKE